MLLPFVAMAQTATDVVQPPKEFNPAGWDWAFIAACALTVLIILVIARAFDIGSLTEKVTGKKVIGWTKVNAWLAIIIIIAGAAGITYEMIYHGKLILLNDSASEHGKTIDSMFNWTFGFTFLVFCITEILLFWFMFRYRYREGEKALYYLHNNKLEVFWTIVPAIVLTFLVLRGFNTWSRITDPSKVSKDATQIEVYAYQFGWKARFAGDDNKFGESNFTFISGTNPLGLAVGAEVDSLMAELKRDISKIDILLASAADSSRVWQTALRDLEAKQNTTAYPEVYKDVLTKATDARTGAYVRNLNKDKKRKQTNLWRIAEYKKNKDFFNNAANDDKITTEIVLVKGKEYVFKFRARDVIHSAYMPEFRAQMNVVPGMATQFAFTPIKTTAEARKDKNNKDFDFHLYCNKICGAAHYNMKIKITVVATEQEYKEWLATQTTVVAPPVVETPEAPKTDSVAPATDKTVAVIHN
ncbi:MAG: cytochrome c oxidase subunit II [Bacteroidia bacterium]|nr:cytochrome c oxidase subunit II [Bacteroidia bacterium]